MRLRTLQGDMCLPIATPATGETVYGWGDPELKNRLGAVGRLYLERRVDARVGLLDEDVHRRSNRVREKAPRRQGRRYRDPPVEAWTLIAHHRQRY